MTSNTINTALKYAIITGLALIAFIPLYVANPLFFPFITGKAFAFRIIVEIVFALWVVLILRERGTGVAGTAKGVAPRMNLVTYIVSAFALITLIADLAGYNPLRSIWSNFERMEGWITIIHLWAYFMVISSVLTNKDTWNRFFNVVIISSTITALYGLFQLFGWAVVHQSASRLDASLGNAAYMAVYMLMSSFISGYLAIGARKAKKTGLVWMYSILLILFTFIIFETATRGSILGWIGGAIVACAIYAIWGRKAKGQSNRSRIIAGGAIVLVILIGVLFYANKNAKFIQNNQTLSRLASISVADTKTQGRAFIWPIAVKETFSGVKSAIIGIGQENFNYYFNKDYNPLMFGQEQWFDRAHSVFIDWLVAAGLLGLIAYLALYAIVLIYITKSSLTLGEKAMLIGLLVGYGIHNVFVFDNQTSYVMFFTFLAFVHSLKSGKAYSWFIGSKKSVSEDGIVMRDYIGVPLIAIAFIAGFYFINVRNIQANTRLITALRSCSSGRAPSAALFESALALNQTTANQEIREQLITCSTNVLNASQAPVQLKNDFYLLTQKEIANQIADAPGDARIYAIGGSYLTSIGGYSEALPILQKAHQLSPGKQAIDFDLATVYMNTDKALDAVTIAKSAYESAPAYAQAQLAYATALINANQEAEARKLFPNNPEFFTSQQIINVYVQQKQFKKVIDIYKKLIADGQNDTQTRFYLVAAYLADKQNYLAIQELQSIAGKFPETKTQVDSIIKDIEAGKDLLAH